MASGYYFTYFWGPGASSEVQISSPSPARTYYLGTGALEEPLRADYLGTWGLGFSPGVAVQLRSTLNFASHEDLRSLPQTDYAAARSTSNQSDYLDPKSMSNNGRLGYFWWLWAMDLHTFGVQVGDFGRIEHTHSHMLPSKQKIGHTQKGTTPEPLSTKRAYVQV